MPNFLTMKELKKKKKIRTSFDGQGAPSAEYKGEITLIQSKFSELLKLNYTHQHISF